MNQLISHLLWANYLILLALYPETLQKQLNTPHSFCLEWGIIINAKKTKFLKFFAGREDHQLTEIFYNRKIREVESYCHLGVEIHNSGTNSLAPTEYKKKAIPLCDIGALCAMKNTVNITFNPITHHPIQLPYKTNRSI